MLVITYGSMQVCSENHLKVIKHVYINVVISVFLFSVHFLITTIFVFLLHPTYIIIFISIFIHESYGGNTSEPDVFGLPLSGPVPISPDGIFFYKGDQSLSLEPQVVVLDIFSTSNFSGLLESLVLIHFYFWLC